MKRPQRPRRNASWSPAVPLVVGLCWLTAPVAQASVGDDWLPPTSPAGCPLVRDEDSWADGSATQRRTFDAHGTVVKVEGLADGKVTRTNTWVATYNEAGKVETLALDSEANGTVDQRIRRTWSDQGVMLTEETDNKGDGTVDVRVTTTVDQAGRPSVQESDFGADGKADGRTTYEYDDAGRLVVEHFDYSANGVVDVQKNGTPWDKWTRYSYDDLGRLVTEEWDFGGDGGERVLPGDRTLVFTYDDAGRLLTESVGDGGAAPVLRRSWRYDAGGMLVERLLHGTGGTVVQRTRYTYKCG